VKGILASYRWRRRLAWLTTAAFVVVAAIVVGLKWPNTAAKEPPVSNVPLRFDYSAPKARRLTVHDKVALLTVVRRFIDTAVSGEDIDASWDLVSPDFRAGLTRKQWASGEMPVVPFPVREARWKLDYADVNGVGYEMSLFPTKGSHMRAQVFLIGLHELGAGTRRHWVVDSWQAAPTSGSTTLSGGGGGGTNVSQMSPKVDPFGQSRLSSAWLILPFSLLSLIVLVPLGIISLNWYRGHRAMRALQRS
jgi:hypothetical protein